MSALSPDDQAWLDMLVQLERAKAQAFLDDLLAHWEREVSLPRVCGNRADSPGSFDSCQRSPKAPCACSVQVKADLAEDPYAYAVGYEEAS